MDEHIIHEHLDAVLKLRGYCQGEDANPESFQRFLQVALGFVRVLMTEDVFRRAMKQGSDGEGLLLFANRVQLLKPLLSDNWPNGFSFDELVDELFGIANGDAPRLLRGHGKQGKFSNAHALVSKKLDAHLWYKVLGALGVKATIRQGLIIEHYAITLDAFLKWRKEAKDKLTADYVERYLVSGLGSSLSLAALQDDPIAWATTMAKQAGADYRQELTRTKG